jgi:hypothetical protein
MVVQKNIMISKNKYLINYPKEKVMQDLKDKLLDIQEIKEK